MLTLLFTMNVMTTLIFITLMHPLSMGMMLLIQTTLISLISGNFNSNYWYSYILFLILVGGMLILFMYMTSIASNEKFMFNTKLMLMTLLIPIIMMIPNTYMEMNMINNELSNFTSELMINYSLNKYINFPANLMLIFMIIYLLLTLVATVKIANIKQGPIRQMN